ncbi:hypothetical protein PTTG_06196 [Puccinia triticina 1-1 BBBD Race 1]|uniref:Uncharacterized protein n=1 Tax=Puccinia triticina (isolate 1-1 / race 1 (BBBD)) TaxID=630390 RepID=A0A180GK83_PUCT1|nr:hypothetical protein PTTG_06196 [Puccinia triticina 1-1 BBBD Race 1]
MPVGGTSKVMDFQVTPEVGPATSKVLQMGFGGALKDHGRFFKCDHHASEQWRNGKGHPRKGQRSLFSPTPRRPPRKVQKSPKARNFTAAPMADEQNDVNAPMIQTALQSIEGSFSLSSDLLQRAHPLFQMTPDDRNLAILLLAIHNGIQPSSINPSAIVPHEPSTANDTFEFSNYFKGHVRNLARQAAQRLRVVETPVSLVQEAIAKASPEFCATHLPPNDPKNAQLNKLITEMVKQGKNALAIHIKVGMTGTGPLANVPKLYSLIPTVYGGFHPDFKKLSNSKIHSQIRSEAKVQLCYLRFMANMNQIQHRRKTIRKQILFWDGINKDLAQVRKK